MSAIKSLTIDELVAYLTQFPHDTKVFMSKDSEGNSFGTVSVTGYGSEYHEEDGAVVLYPLEEGLDFEEVFPKTYDRETSE